MNNNRVWFVELKTGNSESEFLKNDSIDLPLLKVPREKKSDSDYNVLFA